MTSAPAPGRKDAVVKLWSGHGVQYLDQQISGVVQTYVHHVWGCRWSWVWPKAGVAHDILTCSLSAACVLVA